MFPSARQTKSGQTSPNSRLATGMKSADDISFTHGMDVSTVLALNEKKKKRAKDFECAVRANIGQAGSRRARRGLKMSTLTPADPRLKKVFPESTSPVSEGSMNLSPEDRLSILTSASPRSEALLLSLSSPDQERIIKTPPELGRLCPIPPESASPYDHRFSAASMSTTPKLDEATYERKSQEGTSFNKKVMKKQTKDLMRNSPLMATIIQSEQLETKSPTAYSGKQTRSSSVMVARRTHYAYGEQKPRPATAEITRVPSVQSKRQPSPNRASGQTSPSKPISSSCKTEKQSTRPASVKPPSPTKQGSKIKQNKTTKTGAVKEKVVKAQAKDWLSVTSTRATSVKNEKPTKKPSSAESEKQKRSSSVMSSRTQYIVDKEPRPATAEITVPSVQIKGQPRKLSGQTSESAKNTAPSLQNEKQSRPASSKPVKSPSSTQPGIKKQPRPASSKPVKSPSSTQQGIKKQPRPASSKPVKSPSSTQQGIKIKQTKTVKNGVVQEKAEEVQEIDLVINGRAPSNSRDHERTCNMEQSKADEAEYREYVQFLYSKYTPEMIISGTGFPIPGAIEIDTTKHAIDAFDRLQKKDQELLDKLRRFEKDDADVLKLSKELNEANDLLAHLEHDVESLEEQKNVNICILKKIKNEHIVLMDEKVHLQKQLFMARKAHNAHDKRMNKEVERLSTQFEKLNNKEKAMRRRIAVLEAELSLIISKLDIPKSKEKPVVPRLDLYKLNKKRVLPVIKNSPTAPRKGVNVKSINHENFTEFNTGHRKRVVLTIPKVSNSTPIMQNDEWIKPVPTARDNRTRLPAINPKSAVIKPVKKCLKKDIYQLKPVIVEANEDAQTEEVRFPDIVKGSQFMDKSKIVPKSSVKRAVVQKKPPFCAHTKPSTYFSHGN